MRKKGKYIEFVYEDFVERVRWYFYHDMLSESELNDIIKSLSDIKGLVQMGFIPERAGVMELTNVFREYSIV